VCRIPKLSIIEGHMWKASDGSHIELSSYIDDLMALRKSLSIAMQWSLLRGENSSENFDTLWRYVFTIIAACD
jgi:hypothetical protein